MTVIAKSAKTHPAAKNSCGWEEPAICHDVIRHDITCHDIIYKDFIRHYVKCHDVISYGMTPYCDMS